MSDGDWFTSMARIIGDKKLYDLIGQLDRTGLLARGYVHGLDEDEVLSIYTYTMSDAFDGRSLYSTVNQALRTQRTDGIELLVRTLVSAVGKMPRYGGVVVRRTELPNDVLNLNQGEVFSDLAFLSTSQNLDPRRRMYFGRDVLFLRSQSGRDISTLSAFGGEQEVLFLPGARFRLSSVNAAVTGFSLIGDQEDDPIH